VRRFRRRARGGAKGRVCVWSGLAGSARRGAVTRHHDETGALSAREVKRRGVMRRRGARTVDSGQLSEGLDIPARLHLRLAGFHAAFASRRGRDISDHQPRAGHLVVRRFGFLRGVAVAAVGRRGIRGGVRGGHRVAGKRKRARRVGDKKGGCDLGCRRARLGVVVRSSERFATLSFELCHPPMRSRDFHSLPTTSRRSDPRARCCAARRVSAPRAGGFRDDGGSILPVE